MNTKDQQLLEEAYEVCRIKGIYLTEGVTSQVLQWAENLFRKKFPDISKAWDQAWEKYKKDKNLDAAADIIANALHKGEIKIMESADVQTEGIVSDAKKFIGKKVGKAVDAVTPYVQSVAGLISSPQDLIQVARPKIFVQVLKKLSDDYAQNLKLTLRKAKSGDLGVRDYAVKNPKAAAVSIGKKNLLTKKSKKLLKKV
jgi:hypothetical protein